jgi:competence protein ComEC
MKVAHHGSKNSTLDNFLSIVKPEYSIVSCGKDNRYGHPNPELLQRLTDIGSNTLITYKTGAVTVETDGRDMELHGFLK